MALEKGARCKKNVGHFLVLPVFLSQDKVISGLHF